MPLDKVVINTEGHPLPRFDMGPLFSTGWQRKVRGTKKAKENETKEKGEAEKAKEAEKTEKAVPS